MHIPSSFIHVLAAIFIAGCASVPPTTVAPVAPATQPSPASGFVYHKVEKGQTLWRISKIYDVDLAELARINHLSDATSIEIGQLILIPKKKLVEKSPVCKITSSSDDFIWPLRGKVITSFGQTFNNMINKGLNIAPVSSSDIVASRSGTVVFCSSDFSGFGKTIVIDHGDGFLTVYARNAQVLIKTGDTVTQGMTIAKVGCAGRDKTPYLHFEIRKGYASQNPNFYLTK
ncbi:MAG TPA: LysM peptidoglycan-binding domain-containing M23 family metallopeptidase [Candidatus Omnitrophota bacterium]|nr:LysM peptidoglycan-binding domain-containing M23 family metallopeptidase [Candidatus Omnitrophota bacterium]HPT07637.1 LysM peptidoglycan-binding domain-containing M23 family metallopeptidase [Candidatus Omnitrophota bacterium]